MATGCGWAIRDCFPSSISWSTDASQRRLIYEDRLARSSSRPPRGKCASAASATSMVDCMNGSGSRTAPRRPSTARSRSSWPPTTPPCSRCGASFGCARPFRPSKLLDACTSWTWLPKSPSASLLMFPRERTRISIWAWLTCATRTAHGLASARRSKQTTRLSTNCSSKAAMTCACCSTPMRPASTQRAACPGSQCRSAVTLCSRLLSHCR